MEKGLHLVGDRPSEGALADPELDRARRELESAQGILLRRGMTLAVAVIEEAIEHIRQA